MGDGRLVVCLKVVLVAVLRGGEGDGGGGGPGEGVMWWRWRWRCVCVRVADRKMKRVLS